MTTSPVENGTEMRLSYFWVSTIAAVYSWMVAAAWLIAPSVPIWGWGLDGGDEVVSMGRRVAVLVAGLGVALFLVRREPPSRARRAVTIGFLVAWVGAAGVSAVAFATGVGGFGMLATVVIELIVSAALALAEFGSRRSAAQEPAERRAGVS